MFNHALLISSFAVTSILAATSTALAQTVDVPFNGIVSPVTSIEVTEEPTISSGTGINLNTFEATNPAIVTINTTAPINVIVSAPTPVGFNDTQGTQYIGFLNYNGTEVQHGTPMNINSIGDVDLEVGMKVVRPQAYPPGNYTYKMTLTVLAQ